MSEPAVLSNLLTVTPAGVIAAGVIIPIFSCSAVALRLYGRRWQDLGIRAEDWTILAGAALIGVMGVILVVGAAIGALGRHSTPYAGGPNPNDDVIAKSGADAKAERIVQAYSIVEKPAYAFVKLSIVLLYRRIFVSPALNVIAVASTVVLALMTVAFVTASAFQCTERNWEIWWAQWALDHHCVSEELTTFAFAIADVITDVVIIVIPLPFLWNLKMSRRRKLSVFIIFTLGASSITLAIIRQAIISVYTYKGTRGFRDLLGVQTSVVTLSLVEGGIAIIAACIPAFRAFLTAKFGDSASSTHSKHHKSDRSRSVVSRLPKGSGGDIELDTLVEERDVKMTSRSLDEEISPTQENIDRIGVLAEPEHTLASNMPDSKSDIEQHRISPSTET